MQFFKSHMNKKSILYVLLVVFIVIMSLSMKNINTDAATYTASEAASKIASQYGWEWDSTRSTWKTHVMCPDTSHSWYLRYQGWSKQPTCATSGTAKLYCPSCGLTQTTSVNAYAHNQYQTSSGGYIRNKCHDCSYDSIVRPIKYQIAYNKNDSAATGSMANTTGLSYGSTYTLRANGFSKQYYNFIGWATSANGNVVYPNRGSVSNLTQTDNGTVTLYAKWEGVKSTLMVSPFGGNWNGYTDTQIYEKPYKTTMDIPVPTRKGYKFVKWNVVFNYGTLTSTTGPAKFTFGHDEGSITNLVAEWELQKYTITFNGNGNDSGSLSTITFDQNFLDANGTGSIKIPSCTFRKNGYTFTGWNTKADGTGTAYQPGDKYSSLANLKLYAQWSINGSSLSVNPNGGTWNGYTTIQNYNGRYGETKTIPVPTRSGYTFQGWEFGGGSGTMSTTGASTATYTFGNRSGLTDTLTAKWKEDKYTITYKANGGSGSDVKQTKAATSSVVLFSNMFSRSGYAFYQWNTRADGSGTAYDELATYSTNQNLTLYAIWVTDNHDSTNQKKTAFDTDLDLPNVKVTNVTLTYDTSNDVTVDFGSNTTDVAFDCWTKYSAYTNDDYSYTDYNTGSAVTGNYYDEYYSTKTETKLKEFVGCDQCGTSGDLCFHGSLSSTAKKHYDYNHGSWANNSGEHKGEERRSLAVAKFKGSWKLVLPNAYKTGYVFTGWYVKVNSGTVGGETIPELGSGTWKYVGMGGYTWDLTDIVREHNTNVSSSNQSPTGIATSEISTGVNDNLSGIILHPRFEPIRYKILYVMNIPASSDASTAHNGLQSHTLLSNPVSLSNVHSLKKDGDAATKYVTDTASVGSTNSNHKNYSYIGTKTYTYDGSDWTLENMPITVNDYYFTGWTYDDIVWTGYGGMKENGVVLGSTRIGNSLEDTHDVGNDYSLKTLSMSPNVVQNIMNNLPHKANANSGYYTSHYTVPTSRTFGGLAVPQSDGTNSKAGTQVSTLNKTNPTVYIVLKANWDTTYEGDVTYHANNDTGASYTDEAAYTKLTDYYTVFSSKNGNLVDAGFGTKPSTYVVDSNGTAVGDTSNDGSYDYNATSDRFVVNKNTDKYYSGVSNGRNGFFSFQGWSTWKYATWRDAIDVNKKDTNTSELQFAGAMSGGALGHDSKTINSTFTSGNLTMRRYNDVERTKRVGDLFYRMTAVLYPTKAYNTARSTLNSNGNMVSTLGNGDKYKPSISETIWDAYKWRWEQGSDGNYSIAVNDVFNDRNIDLYAIWDSYPTSFIENIYVYLNDIESLTPKYLFSKVVAYDYEDFWNQKNFAIGETYQGGVSWGSVAKASSGMNTTKGSLCADGDYTYTYNIKSDEAYMGGKFTATLVGYDFDRFRTATFVDDVASVSMTFKFTDSAGNSTYKTAWVYVIDEDDTEREQIDPADPDNTRYSLTRFISKDFYKDTAQWDANGNYIIGSANENAGSLLVRSKWYLNNSYKDQLMSAFDRLENVGGSEARIDANILGLWSGKVNYVYKDTGENDPDEIPGTQHRYHPQLNLNTGKWEYPWDNIKTQTKGVYVLDYDDILKTKQFIQTNNLDTGNYSGNTLQKYIDEIFKNAAAKDSSGNALRIAN